MPSIDPLADCRRKCLDDFKARVKEATDNLRDNLAACKAAYDAALVRCASDPDPLACRDLANDNFTECQRQSAELFGAAVDTARLEYENCLTMCQLRFTHR